MSTLDSKAFLFAFAVSLGGVFFFPSEHVSAEMLFLSNTRGSKLLNAPKTKSFGPVVVQNQQKQEMENSLNLEILKCHLEILKSHPSIWESLLACEGR